MNYRDLPCTRSLITNEKFQYCTRRYSAASCGIEISRSLLVNYAVHLRTKKMTIKWYLNFKNKIIDVEITINEVEIATFEHQLTNCSNPMTHSLKFKFKIWKKFWIIFWTSTYEIRIYYLHESQKSEWQLSNLNFKLSFDVNFKWNHHKTSCFWD